MEFMKTRHLIIDSATAFADALGAAAAVLRAGGVVAVPTETVYGLAGNALDENAVATIFAAKQRPSHNPLIVHVANLAMAKRCVEEWSEGADQLAANFWPGPLTLVLPKAAGIPDIVTAGGPTAAIRCPAHPFMRKLIEECGFPLAAPSANLANQISPTTASHVLASLEGRIPLVVDAGACGVGIESTVVDLAGEGWRVLRPGMISGGQIEELLGTPPRAADAAGAALRSPGLLRRHYSPRARLHVTTWGSARELEEKAAGLGVPFERIHLLVYEQVPSENQFGRVAVIPRDPEAYARALYAELHRADEEGASVILVEAPPDSGAWEGIHDRLMRASAQE